MLVPLRVALDVAEKECVLDPVVDPEEDAVLCIVEVAEVVAVCDTDELPVLLTVDVAEDVPVEVGVVDDVGEVDAVDVTVLL